MKNPNEIIAEGLTLSGAKTQFGSDIKTYDDGSGDLYIHRDSMGISGIVRADSWEDAYGICEDEFFPEASETIEDFENDYGFTTKDIKIVKTKDGQIRPAKDSDYPFGTSCVFDHWEYEKTTDKDAWPENEIFAEAFGFRPNGPNQSDVLKHGIYSKDLNGDSLEVLTVELLEALQITLEIKAW